MREHVHNVQALRGVACLLVVVGHIQHWDGAFGTPTPLLAEFRRFGFAGVDLFFVLSGFVIASTNRQHLGRPAALGSYAWRRFWRIYPAYWAAMAVAAASGWAVLGWQPLGEHGGAKIPGWLTLAPGGPGNVLIGQAWTLVYEVMFYVAFAVLLIAPRRFAGAILGGWAGLAAAAAFQPQPENPFAEHALSPYVLEFLAGCAIAGLAGRGIRAGWRTALALGLAYAVAGIVWVSKTIPEPYGLAMASERMRVAVFGPAAAMIVYGAVAAEGRWPRRVPAWLLRTGDASYSLYLIHWTVMLASVALVGVHVPHTRVPHLLWLAATLAAAFAAGYAFYALVERPLLALRKRRRAVPAAPVALPVRKAA